MNRSHMRLNLEKSLRRLLRNRNMSASQLSKKLGKKECYVRNLLNGQVYFRESIIQKIADVMEIPVIDFILYAENEHIIDEDINL